MTERLKQLAGSKTSLGIFAVLAPLLGGYVGGWYGVKAEQRVQAVEIQGLKDQVADVQKRMPDGQVIDRRLTALENVVSAAAFFDASVRLRTLENEAKRKQTEDRLFQDAVWGRVYMLPWHTPPPSAARKD